MKKFCNIRSFFFCNRGVAATEFAVALPFIMALMLGGFELSHYVIVHQKLEKVAYTISDIVSQSDTVTIAQLEEAVKAAGAIMQPTDFKANTGVVFISSVSKTGTNAPTVRWQYKSDNGVGKSSKIGAVNGVASLPNGLTLNDKDNIIISEVLFTYPPLFTGGLFAESAELYKVTIFKPRLGALTTPPV